MSHKLFLYPVFRHSQLSVFMDSSQDSLKICVEYICNHKVKRN